MSTKKIVVGIIGAMLVAGCTASAGYFPNLTGILTTGSALIVAVISYINGMDNED